MSNVNRINTRPSRNSKPTTSPVFDLCCLQDPVDIINAACEQTQVSLESDEIWPEIKATRAVSARKNKRTILDDEVATQIHRAARTDRVDVTKSLRERERNYLLETHTQRIYSLAWRRPTNGHEM